MRDYTILSDYLKEYNILLSDHQKLQFDRYYEVLIETNQVMNLTAITEFPDVLEKHFLDSAALISVINLKDVSSVIDVGTGAGFPGLPLKILFPHLKIVLMDSLQKRVNFLNSIIDELKLTDISAVHARAEEFGKKNEYRQTFDLCVSRAVAALRVLTELCIPFIRIGGSFIPYKSGEIRDELKEASKAIEITGGRLNSVETRIIGPSALHRSFPVIVKENDTPGKYPRKAGMPSRNPL